MKLLFSVCFITVCAASLLWGCASQREARNAQITEANQAGAWHNQCVSQGASDIDRCVADLASAAQEADRQQKIRSAQQICAFAGFHDQGIGYCASRILLAQDLPFSEQQAFADAIQCQGDGADYGTPAFAQCTATRKLARAAGR